MLAASTDPTTGLAVSSPAAVSVELVLGAEEASATTRSALVSPARCSMNRLGVLQPPQAVLV